MCASCHYDAQPIFEGIECVLKKDCKPWQPYLVLILTITIQLVLIVVILRKNMVDNSAVLYKPLFMSASYSKCRLASNKTILHSNTQYQYTAPPSCSVSSYLDTFCGASLNTSTYYKIIIYFSLSWSIHCGSCCIRNICTAWVAFVLRFSSTGDMPTNHSIIFLIVIHKHQHSDSNCSTWGGYIERSSTARTRVLFWNSYSICSDISPHLGSTGNSIRLPAVILSIPVFKS